jgi:hypothetical protein
MQRVDGKEPVAKEQNPCGLTEDEQEVMNKLNECYAAFFALGREHPDEMRDFIDGVHRIQDVMAVRVVRRCYPEGWPTYGKD